MSYETLAITWFGLWGLLWAVYFMLDGFDLGVGLLYPFIAKSDREKSHLMNSIGPFWDGNEVWLVTAGGATFAAFPSTYAVMFSTFYMPFMLILLGLIFRGTAIEFVGKSESQQWKQGWKWAFFFGSFLVVFIFGVVFANMFQGIAFDENGYHGTFLSFFNGYGIMGGLLFIALFVLTGAVWIGLKTADTLSKRAMEWAGKLWYIVVGITMIFLGMSYSHTTLYQNYLNQPIWFIVPAIAILALLGVKFFISKNDAFKSFISSSVLIFTTTFFGIIGLFPNMFPSSLGQEHSLTVFNSSSSEYTLNIMLVVVLIFVPIVIFYQIMMFKIFSGKVTDEDTHY